MKNKRLEDRRKKIPNEIDLFVNQSFDIVDRIHAILAKQGKEQKDLAIALGKSESEISKWMTGTHNFTIKTLAKIESVLGERIIQVSQGVKHDKPAGVKVDTAAYAMPKRPAQYYQYPKVMETIVISQSQLSGNYLN